MKISENTAATITTTLMMETPTSSNSIPSSPPSPPPVILSPCAACKILRRRCVDKCVLAPYFPPTDPLKFTIAHRVFGASNIIKLLQELPEEQRADAVNSMVYEANARLRDPVYGCAGAICQLQKQISELQAELAKSQAEKLNIQCHNANLLDMICKQMVMAAPHEVYDQQTEQHVMLYDHDGISNILLDENESVFGSIAWDPLWT